MAGAPLRASVVVALLVCVLAPAQAAAAINRPQDPVIVSGGSVPALNGIAPGEIVAFAYNAGWQQVPVQVDERAEVDLAKPYNSSPIGVTFLAYTDPGTYTGPDPDPTLDADDEIALMAKDTGTQAPAFSAPAGVLPGTGEELHVADPLGSGDAYVYLFRRSGSLDPGAGQHYVNYQFALLAGTYPANYNLNGGPNPENSTVVTPFYEHHFSDRWIDDQLKVKAGAATGADILDRHRFQFAPGSCIRTEDTFSNGEGNFVVNKNGPVRAIRTYMGANSGPYTERQHVFYQRRQDLTTQLRVHQIGGAMDLFDYSPAAGGMTLKDDFNAAGVAIDGAPDSLTAGQITWESVDGPQGGLSMSFQTITDIPNPSYSSYYLDKLNPSAQENTCTGDGAAYGVSGPWINHQIPSTDPVNGTYSLSTTRFLYYEAPGQANGPARRAQAANPLQVTATSLPSGYPRPSGASPTRVPLVPAYRQCTAPNRTHGAPLSFPSCAPPAHESSFLTLGTADANGAGAHSVGSLLLRARLGDEATPADEADVELTASITDARNTGGLGDYIGETQARVTLRITDRDNNGTDAGTVTDLPFAFTVPCAVTVQMTVGATCAISTSADAISAGAVKEERRSIWQLGTVQVLDGGSDGLASTPPNGVFARQGVFIP